MLKLRNWGKWMQVLSAVILAISLCLMPANTLAKNVKVLRIGIGIDADSLNPLELTTAIPANICELLYGTLLKTNAKGEVIPNMGTEWSVSEDGLNWTIKLRKGIKFIDGTPFNAHTLKRNLELIQDPNVRVPLRFIYAAIKSLTVVDDYTVQYQLNAPYALFKPVLATVMMPISQKAVTPYDGARLSQNPVGAGPYKLAEWIKGERIVLVRNEN